jgi:tetratricopeptide (TPR) repeat protein
MNRNLILNGLLLTSVLASPVAINAQQRYQQELVQKIFQEVNHTFGAFRGSIKIELMKAQKSDKPLIAQYRAIDQKILLSEQVYELCRGLGSDSLNSLAIIIGHELSHHYLKHSWNESYGFSEESKNIPVHEKEQLEKEADFYGCYAAQVAGYYTDAAFYKIIEAIYQHFDLTNKLKGSYPSKEVRQQTYRHRSRELQQLVAVFRMGQLLYLNKSFVEASTCFEYISRSLPSPEVLNNYAAALIQSHLSQESNPRVKKFIFPIEFDVNTRLNTQPKLRGRGENQLKEAQQRLENALAINPDYVAARINLACVYVLQNNPYSAIGEISKLDQLNTDALTIRGFAFFQIQEIDKARKDLDAARHNASWTSEFNWRIFNKLVAVPSWLDVPLAKWQRILEKLRPSPTSLAPLSDKIPSESGFEALISGSEVLKIQISNSLLKLDIQNKKGVYRIRWGKNTCWFVENGVVAKSKNGIGIGSKTDQMWRVYGQKHQVFALAVGLDAFMYEGTPGQKLIFVSQDKKIVQWGVIISP